MKKLFAFLCIVFFFSNQLNAQDIYHVNWSLKGKSYQAAIIVFNNSYGISRVKYLKDGERTMVEQSLRYESTNSGFNLYGSKPVYPGTSIYFPNYTADDFLITVNKEGSLYVICADATFRMQPFGTFIQKITNKSDQVIFLRMFDWRL